MDSKMKLIQAEYGLKGFAIVVKLWQMIYREHGYYSEWNDEKALLFAYEECSDCGVKLLNEIVETCFRKEKVVPVITITAPTASQYLANSTPAIAWKITDDDSGVNPSTIALKIDGTAVDTSKITKTAVTGGYTCSYTPASALSDGAHTVVATASDYDGNAAAQKSVTFTVDTIPPTLSISAPAEGFITNKSTVTVKGTTDDATSKPVTVTVNGAPIPVTPSGTFSNDVTLKEGSNTITIVAKDKAGKTTTVTRTVKLDTAPPVIKSATITPNPVDCGKTWN